MRNEKPFQQFYRKQLTGSYFKCIKCKDTGLRIEVNEYVPCDCGAGEALGQWFLVDRSPMDPNQLYKNDSLTSASAQTQNSNYRHGEPRHEFPVGSLMPLAPSEQKFSHELEKSLYSPAFAPGVARTDALRLKAIAHAMSINAYGSYGSEADMRTLNEIAMRLETGFYTGGKP